MNTVILIYSNTVSSILLFKALPFSTHLIYKNISFLFFHDFSFFLFYHNLSLFLFIQIFFSFLFSLDLNRH